MTGLARLTLPFPQIAAGLGLSTLIMGGLFWVQGQRMHSAKVDAANARAEVVILKKAMVAHAAADKKQKERTDAFDRSQDALRVVTDPADYLRQLRGQQTGEHPATTP